MEEYKISFPDDVRVELLIMKNRNTTLLPEIFEAKLWKLLNDGSKNRVDGSENRDVSEYLIWYLLGVENYNDIELVLERSENRYPESNWTGYYRGVLSGIRGDYSTALKYLNSKDLDIPNWELQYNRGLMEMARGNYPEAMTHFNKSLIGISNRSMLNNIDVYKSQIKTKIAQVLISLDDIDEAIRVLNSAIELDPNNYRSDLLKSIHLNIKDIE